MSAWTLIRTLAGDLADAPGPPLAATGVALPANMSIVEFRVRNLVTTGNPTALVLFFWRIQTGTVELIGEQVIQTADNVMPDPKRVISESPDVYVTIGFTGGTDPTATGLIEARGLFGLTDMGIGVVPGVPSAWGLYQEDTAHVSGDWGQNILSVRRDVAVSSAGSDGDYAELNTNALGYLYAVLQSYDSASNADRGFEVAPVWGRNIATPVTIDTAKVVTGAWADLGPEIPLQGYTKIGLWLNITQNDSQNIRVRCLLKHTSAHANEYALPIVSVDVTGPPFNLKVQPEYIEFDVDASQLICLNFDLYNWIPFVQFRIMAEVAGAVPAVITNAEVTYGYGGA